MHISKIEVDTKPVDSVAAPAEIPESSTQIMHRTPSTKPTPTMTDAPGTLVS